MDYHNGGNFLHKFENKIQTIALCIGRTTKMWVNKKNIDKIQISSVRYRGTLAYPRIY